jgi:hypothetical protein
VTARAVDVDEGIIRWADPGEGRRSDEARWAPTVRTLSENPGEWAVVSESDAVRAATLVNYIKRGKGPFGPEGTYEACSRTLRKPDRSAVVAVYARYVGLLAEG